MNQKFLSQELLHIHVLAASNGAAQNQIQPTILPYLAL